MEAPPVNRLLQLLRQKPVEPLEQAPLANDSPVSPSLSSESDTQPVTKSSTQYVKSSTQPVTKSSTQPVKSSTQPATKSSIPKKVKSDILYATNNEAFLSLADLSKGQQRVLDFLLLQRDISRPSQTRPVGYDAISTHCILSRSGSRKVIGELCKKGLIAKQETKRGDIQGSIYLLKSSTLSVTKNDIPIPEKSSTLSATFADLSCSSIKKQLLQDLVLEHAFEDLNPRSLVPYLGQFTTLEELQNFLDIANACIIAAKEGQNKPIKNPHGFLIAQLRAGYVNPPEGYKSRKIRSQELKNQQLEEELATLKRLREREQELQFDVFVARLTAEDLARLEHEAQALIQSNIGLSAAFQLQMHKDALLKQWFTRQRLPLQEPTGEP